MHFLSAASPLYVLRGLLFRFNNGKNLGHLEKGRSLAREDYRILAPQPKIKEVDHGSY